MYENKLRKTIYTLNIDNYAPKICELTYPLIKAYAHKIDADFRVIDKRVFPANRAPVYEKLQIYDLARQRRDDWSIYIDSDTLVNPDMFDVTAHISKDTVMHHGRDMATHRWRYDRIFMRDGRHIGSCNWFACASDWCVELWKPPEDQTYEEALDNIFPTVNERRTVIETQHLIDDYTLSRNIAMYGFKFKCIIDLCKELEIGLAPGNPGFFWHQYTIPVDQKVIEMNKCLHMWGVKN